jgi:hypothetical protein
MFPIHNGLKEGSAILPFHFSFALKYVIRKVHENQVGHTSFWSMLLILIYWGIIGTSKEVGLEVNTEKTKYLLMSCQQNAGQNYNVKTVNEAFENPGMFKYFGTTINQDLIHEEIKSKLNSGNACCRSFQNCLSSCLLRKNIMM